MRVMTKERGSGSGFEGTGGPGTRKPWILDPHSSILVFRTLDEKHREQRDGPAGRSFFLARFPRRSRNVEVGPVILACESRKETGRRNAARSGPADICKIGEVAFQLFLIILPQWQPPDAVQRLRPRCLHLVCQAVLVRVQPGADVSQGDDAGPRK